MKWCGGHCCCALLLSEKILEKNQKFDFLIFCFDVGNLRKGLSLRKKVLVVG